MRRWLYEIAQRVHMPVYRIEQEMPAHELCEWIMFLTMEANRNAPPSFDEVGSVEAMAAGLGVKPDGS